MRILFLASRFPWPLLRGDQSRAYHQLRLLAPRHRTTLACFHGDPPPSDGMAALSALCERVVTVPLGKAAMALALGRGALSDLPFQVSLYRHARMRQALRRLLAEQAFDLVHVQLARMAPHAEGLPLPRFVDLVDALSLSTLRRSAQHRGPLRWLTGLEARRLLRYERRLCGRLEGACVASIVDRDAIDGGPRLGIVPNGVDLARFRFERRGRDPATVVFTGNMGYFPNVNAVQWFAGKVWPLVRQQVPGARFDILGARPAAGVRRLASAEGAVRVLGWVEDVRAHLGTATVAVAPLQAGAGQQFKVLEAMASGVPVVATPIAARGLEAGEGEGLLVAASPGDFAQKVAELLADPRQADGLAARARRFVEERYTWERSTARLEELHEAARARRPTL